MSHATHGARMSRPRCRSSSTWKSESRAQYLGVKAAPALVLGVFIR